MAPSTVTFKPPSTESIIDSDGKPFFDGDDMKLPLFMTALQRYIEENHPEYAAFLENNYTPSFDNRKMHRLDNRTGGAHLHGQGANAHVGTPPTALDACTATEMPKELAERCNVAPERLRVSEVLGLQS